jgi:hypothetical protein
MKVVTLIELHNSSSDEGEIECWWTPALRRPPGAHGGSATSEPSAGDGRLWTARGKHVHGPAEVRFIEFWCLSRPSHGSHPRTRLMIVRVVVRSTRSYFAGYAGPVCERCPPAPSDGVDLHDASTVFHASVLDCSRADVTGDVALLTDVRIRGDGHLG